MTPKLFGTIGIILSHIGFILVFRFGTPYRRLTGGRSTRATIPDDKVAIAKAKKIDTRYILLGKAGFMAVTIGAVAQLIAVLLS